MNTQKETRKVKIYKGNGSPILASKTSRNQPCPCKSGKKAKSCCGANTTYHHSDPDLVIDQQQSKRKTL